MFRWYTKWRRLRGSIPCFMMGACMYSLWITNGSCSKWYYLHKIRVNYLHVFIYSVHTHFCVRIGFLPSSYRPSVHTLYSVTQSPSNMLWVLWVHMYSRVWIHSTQQWVLDKYTIMYCGCEWSRVQNMTSSLLPQWPGWSQCHMPGMTRETPPCPFAPWPTHFSTCWPAHSTV